MLEQNQTSKVNKLDFGVNLKKRVESGKSLFASKKVGVTFSLRDSIKVLMASRTKIQRFYKVSTNFLNRMKWSFSRSIFFGRGIYFKYISNLALLLVVSFGAFVYLGYDKGSNGFISKYAGVSASSSGVLFNPGGQTVIAQKQFKVTQYTVQPGDSLSSIAAKYSSQDNVITVDSILWANGLRSSDLLKPGMKLDIPPVSGVLHTVKKGDTIIAVAKKYKLITDKSSAEEINGVTQQITDINLLDIKVVQTAQGESRVPELVEGQRIIIPGGILVNETPVYAINPPKTVAVGGGIINTGPAGSFGWPINGGGQITQGYSSYFHPAIDIANSIAPELLAMDNGVIKFVGFKEWRCNLTVEIDFGNGYSSTYCHMSGFAPGLKAGQPVSKGQVVGRMGQSGAATGIHVHLVVYYKGVEVNPCKFAIFAGKGKCA